MKTEAEDRIFQGQIANARNSTMYCQRGIVMYLGNNMLLSEPNGIMLAAMFVPRIDTIQTNAERKTANRVLADQYRSRMAPSKSQGFHNSKPQLLLTAAVERIPSEAERVTDKG